MLSIDSPSFLSILTVDTLSIVLMQITRDTYNHTQLSEPSQRENASTFHKPHQQVFQRSTIPCSSNPQRLEIIDLSVGFGDHAVRLIVHMSSVSASASIEPFSYQASISYPYFLPFGTLFPINRSMIFFCMYRDLYGKGIPHVRS